ncbi:MAG: septum site-determining protein MinC [Acetobacteraceae bacterium]
MLAPEPPVDAWLAAFGAQIAHTPGFFDSRPVILDFGLLPPEQPDVAHLIQTIADQGVRVIGTEGAHPSWPGVAKWGGPIGPAPRHPAANGRGGVPVPDPQERAQPAPAARQPVATHANAATLLVEHAVRSGQQILHEAGDVIVLGTVAWGAEIIAGGSIHVYGALRGRAIAGFSGNRRARIFCRRLEAELLAIDGMYRTAEEWDPALQGQPAQIWIDGETLMFALME